MHGTVMRDIYKESRDSSVFFYINKTFCPRRLVDMRTCVRTTRSGKETTLPSNHLTEHVSLLLPRATPTVPLAYRRHSYRIGNTRHEPKEPNTSGQQTKARTHISSQ